MADSTATLSQSQQQSEHEPGNEALDLQEFPEDLISEILGFTTPRHVCRFSAISKLFASAADSSIVWSKFLPQRSADEILSRAVDPVEFSSKKELYFRLCDAILIDGGTKLFWLERETGKVGYMLGARGLTVVWGENDSYWQWDSRTDSRFSECACLRDVCWLEVTGRFDCKLLSANTWYKVVFVFKFKPIRHGFERHGWEDAPVNFSVTTPYGEVFEKRWVIGTNNSALHSALEDGDYYDEHLWLHRIVAKFKVRGDGDYDNSSTHLEFRLAEVEGGQWKRGLVIDGLRIETAEPKALPRDPPRRARLSRKQ